MSIDLLLSKLTYKKTGESRWSARCPSHDDSSPSLSIKCLPDGRILIHCFAGCGACDVITACGLEMDVLFPPETNYKAKVDKRSLDDFVIDIAKFDVENGKRLNNVDRERYRQALLSRLNRPSSHF